MKRCHIWDIHCEAQTLLSTKCQRYFTHITQSVAFPSVRSENKLKRQLERNVTSQLYKHIVILFTVPRFRSLLLHVALVCERYVGGVGLATAGN
jgi:hypothetical protein